VARGVAFGTTTVGAVPPPALPVFDEGLNENPDPPEPLPAAPESPSDPHNVTSFGDWPLPGELVEVVPLPPVLGTVRHPIPAMNGSRSVHRPELNPLGSRELDPPDPLPPDVPEFPAEPLAPEEPALPELLELPEDAESPVEDPDPNDGEPSEGALLAVPDEPVAGTAGVVTDGAAAPTPPELSNGAGATPEPDDGSDPGGTTTAGPLPLDGAGSTHKTSPGVTWSSACLASAGVKRRAHDNPPTEPVPEPVRLAVCGGGGAEVAALPEEPVGTPPLGAGSRLVPPDEPDDPDPSEELDPPEEPPDELDEAGPADALGGVPAEEPLDDEPLCCEPAGWELPAITPGVSCGPSPA
jgi:hypothetical protein